MEAKAKSSARRGKRLETTFSQEKKVDVYDDIEGAHAQQSPLKRTLPNSTPVKKQLDPLRNQKSAVTTSSPSKGGSTLGFFKQFHQPKPEASTATPKGDRKAEKLVNGIGSRTGRQGEDQTDGGAESTSIDSEDEDDQLPADGSVRSTAKGNWKGWTYELPKKTFEDEIRELENVARREAGKDEHVDATAGAAPKRRDRVDVSKQLGDELATDAKEVARTVPQKQSEALQKRKLNQTDHIGAAGPRSSHDEGRKPKDDSTDKRGLAADEARAKSQPVQATTPAKIRPQHSAPSLATSKETTFSGEHLRLIQNILLEKLTGKRLIRPTNLEDEYNKISNLVTQTVTAGESNSMLVIGARGSGKSAIVNQIIREQTAEHADDFHVVRLNGFIHTDDKIALREIWRQLGREMELDEEESTSKNLADTLTTLLALLSHPAEQGRDEPDHVTKSVIFILDEFELFASHPRQTLLYNLFDIAQSRKAPIAVLGLTTRIDVVESLEKRVKSRFSHRYVHLSLAKSFAAFQESCKAAISIHQSELTAEEREQLDVASEPAAKFEKVSNKHKIIVILAWNAAVEALLSHDTLTSHLHRLYYTTKSVPEFHAAMLMPICTMPVESAITNSDLIDNITSSLAGSPLQPLDSKIDLLSSLSILQLALLICAARLTNIHNCDTVRFAQAYEEYKVLASKAKLQASASGALAQGAGSRIWGKEVSKGAWEELFEFGLIMEDGSRGGRVDVGLEEIGMSGVELGSWGRWCKEI